VIGGEALRSESVAPWREHAPDTRLINEYGPTESTVGCSVYEVAPGDGAAGPVPIGRPIANTRLYVVGPGLRAVPAGAPGELWIGGQGLARGYLGRPELTADRFVPDPFAAETGRPGERLYRTGDRVRLRADGELEFLGRIDGQLKIRGFRVEPGEIEAALGAHPKVRECVVMAREDGDSRRLVAYLVPRSRDEKPGASELRPFLEARLPDYMVPAAFVRLDTLPLTPNGKVDRRALPDPGLLEREETPYTPPRTPAEGLLAEVWAEVLGVERVGTQDNFFHLGGDSIRGLMARVRAEKRGVSFTVQQLFEAPTIQELARQSTLTGGPAQPVAQEPFALLAPGDRERLPEGVEDAYPLASLQAGMLFHSELAAGTAIFHDLHSFHLRAPLDEDLLRESLEAVALRHPVLRTAFDLAAFSEPLQLVYAGVAPSLTVHDLRALPAGEQERALEEWLRHERQRAFDWSRPPLLAFDVHRRSDESFQLTMSFHHSILDGWSSASLLTELFRRYVSRLRGEETPEPPLTTAFRDFVALERETLASEEARDFWRQTLAGLPRTRLPRLPVPAERPAPEARAVVRGLPSELSGRLEEAARRADVPLKSVLLAAHLRVLSFLGGEVDVTTGLTSHGRPEHLDGERALGLFLNTLPFRLQLDPGSWLDLARRVFARERELFPFRRFPLAELQRLEGGEPLFEISFTFLHFHVYQEVGNVEGVGVLARGEYEETDFLVGTVFSLDPLSGDLRLRLEHRVPEIGDEQAEAICGVYLRALEAFAGDPDALFTAAPLLSNAETRQLASWGNGGPPASTAPSVLSLFTEQVRRSPEAVALAWEGGRQSYAELDAAANRLAHHLLAQGAGPEQRVGLCLERSPAAIAAMLAVLKTGAAYVPLDPASPEARRELLVREAEISVLLSDAEADAFARRSPADPGREPAAGDLAYVLFTSGSTGRPKGVLVAHGGIANLALAQIDLFGVKPGDRVLQFASLGFDASVSEIWMALLAGAELHLAEAHRLLPGPNLLALLAERQITHLTLPPSVLAVLPAAELPDLAALVVAGEAFPPDLARLWQRSGRHLFNAYGPTEATVCATATGVEAGDGDRVPIGRPIAGTRALVLDRDLSPVPVGVPGEICVGGAGLARGYLGQPGLTAERFGPDPFCGVESGPGERIYHTGDLGRWLPGGALDFLGRIDHQVKVRGFRIEPGEIRAALLAHPGVREAAVIPREDVPGDLRLVAYAVPRPEASPSPGELRGFLEGRLPGHLIPAAFVLLEALPLTPNGKLDRRALPAPGATAEPGETFVAPRTPVEEVLAGLWAGLLGRERIGVHADFFDLGGHSLLATRLIARVRGTFDVDLPLSALFQAPTLAGFAAAVEDALRAGRAFASPPLAPAPRGSALPLSFAQHRLWVIDQLEPGSPVYNIPAAVHLTGALDPAALAAAFAEVALRHEVLRTTFELAGQEPVQRIAPPAPVPLPRVDLSALPEDRREAEARLLAREEALRPFDLRRGPLLRLALLRLAEEEHVLLLALHHIVADAWSMEILIREVSETYSALREKRLPHLALLPVQYADFALWQRRALTPEALDELLRYWRERLAGAPLVLELPSDRPRPAVPSGRGGSVALLVPAAAAEAVASLARREGATLFMTLLAAFGALLHRYTGRDDLVLGTDVANRDRVETESLIGFFVNQLALRLDTGGAPPFHALLRRVREAALGAYAHKDLPFEKLVEELQPQRDLSRNPVFQVSLSLQNAPAAALELPGLSLGSPDARGGVARFDFLVSAREAAGGGLWLATEHSADLFDDATAARLLGHLETLLTAAAAHPGARLPDLPLLSEPERQSLLADWNDPGASGDASVPVHRRFERQAARSPEAIALAWEGRRMSYGELDAAANRLARHLRSLGVGPESRVALLLERSFDLIVALLAVLKAGGAYVPIDPDSPPERTAYLLADSASAVLVTEGDRAEALPTPLPPLVRIDADREAIAALPAGRLAGADDPASLAYVIYTSGSTGRSKGVLVSHANVARLFAVTEDRFRFDAGDVWTFFHSAAFDFSVWEIWGALLYGGRLVVVPHWVARSPEDFHALLAGQSVTVLNQTPSAFQALVAWEQQTAPARELSLRLVIFGGEALNPGSLRPWFERHGDVRPLLVNMYGITETTVHVTWQPLSAADSDLRSSPIGGPLPDLRLCLLGADGNLVPVGVPGEIHVGGAGLARGYLGRPELTAERFVPDPFGGAGERLYRSGDLARRRPGGAIEYLGRIDHQVKIRGFRIELGEIESALRSHPLVREAAVVAVDRGVGD
ncbi:MAG TPA: amino acid adenylation domain-containing protein, partial [Thermoanaerobaculia bacterium]|nr:amino acid adenylation domain-containing protein [Thermoanaerobaculia bacterium]